MTKLCAAISVSLFLSISFVVQAQAPVATGSVAGTITASDTQRPVRFASVTLAPVNPPPPKLPTAAEQKAAQDDPGAAMKMLGAVMSGVTMLSAQTGLDGTYTVEGVAPGDYYLSATAPGYISPVVSALENAPPDAKGKAKLAGVPILHVEAHHASRGDQVLERGAAIFGTITYDDGSPAAGVKVSVKNLESATKKKDDDDDAPDADMMAMMPLMMSTAMAQAVSGTTDDRGRYRLAGVAPGVYRVGVIIAANAGFSMRDGQIDVMSIAKATPLTVYAPSALHQGDAKPVTVKAGEERGDVDIRADLSGLHMVSGSVRSAGDHHLLNAGTVTLADTNDKDFKRSAGLDKDGSFSVKYVPSGSYTLTVSDGADTEPAKARPGAPAGLIRFAAPVTVHSYDDGSQAVLVGANDVAAVNVELRQSKTVKKDFDMNAIFGGGAPPKE